MNILNKILQFFLGNKNKRDIKLIEPYLIKYEEFKSHFQFFSHDELRNKTAEFKYKIKLSTIHFNTKIDKIKFQINNNHNIFNKKKYYDEINELREKCYKKEQEVLDKLLPEAFAVIYETSKRFAINKTIKVLANDFDKNIAKYKNYVVIENDFAIWKNSWNASGKEIIWDMIPYKSQFIGGIVLHSGKIAEMATGEGKTLVAAFPLYLNSLTNKGVHLVTINDYLSKRDSLWMAPLFEFHSLSVDCIDNHEPHSLGRKKAYHASITYGTNSEFGFDYLRDNMTKSKENLVQRELNFAIIDEIDSVLIDDARTPLIISGTVSENISNTQQYNILKPKVEELFLVQQKKLINFFFESKLLIKNKNMKEGGFKLFQVFKGMPKYKPLIKFLSEEGVKSLLQKTERFYIADNNREMFQVVKDLYFIIDEKNNFIELTDKGIEFLSKNSKDKNLFILPDLGSEISNIEKLNLKKSEEEKNKNKIYKIFSEKSDRIHAINQLLKAYSLFEKNIDYVIIGGEIKIIDEQTGRIMQGRRYSDGLHQAIEAKENVKIEASTQTFASITLQNYFRMYKKLAGMTGTAETESAEFWEIYNLDVVIIPTEKPIQREDKEDLIFKTKKEKFKAIINQIYQLSQIDKRPVLVGTTSVQTSELLSRALKIRKIHHNVLNAKLHKKEAQIIAEAGRSGVVTIATNMAGRGTDIKLNKEVKSIGGLAVIGTERHDSRRIDRQLRGRSGRQGDPGSSQFYISLEDNLMRLFGSDRIANLMDRLGYKDDQIIQHSIVSKSIGRAQKKIEENNFAIRKRLLEYDNVMNKQREIIYRRRKAALLNDQISIEVLNIIFNFIELIINENKLNNNFENFNLEFYNSFNVKSKISKNDFFKMSNFDLIKNNYENIVKIYENKKKSYIEILYPIIKNIYSQDYAYEIYKNIFIPFKNNNREIKILLNIDENIKTKGNLIWSQFEKEVSISLIDENWKLHLYEMDQLRNSVQTSSYEQKDPLIIYKQESFKLFLNMIHFLDKEIIKFLFKGKINELNQAFIKYESINKIVNNINKKKIERNKIVKIINIKTGEIKLLKYKQAEKLLLSNNWIIK